MFCSVCAELVFKDVSTLQGMMADSLQSGQFLLIFFQGCLVLCWPHANMMTKKSTRDTTVTHYISAALLYSWDYDSNISMNKSYSNMPTLE